MSKSNSQQMELRIRRSLSWSFRRAKLIIAALLIVGGGFASVLAPPFEQDASALTVGGSWEQITTGGDFNCALSKGEVYCRGANRTGALATTGITRSEEFLKVSGLLSGKAVTQISAGYDHVCALASGEIYCWGGNYDGQLGNGTTIDSSTPVKVTQAAGLLAGKTVTRVSADYVNTCAIADGEAYCWGPNNLGQLGDGTQVNSLVPLKVTQSAGMLAGKSVTDISTSSRSTCAVASGEAYCWGHNNSGRLGDGTVVGSLVPVKVIQAPGILAGKTVSQVSMGYDSGCVLAESEIYCWGANYNGQIGNGTSVSSSSPVRVAQTSVLLAGKTVTKMVSAESGTCAAAGSDLYCWGDNYYGNVGDGTEGNIRYAPVSVLQGDLPVGVTISQISGSEWYSGEHTCALADGQMYCWGDNDHGQLGLEAPGHYLTPIVANHTFDTIDTLPNSTVTEIAKRPTFTGTAEPGSTIVVTVHSDPVVCTTTADVNGDWSCTLPSDLPPGAHTVNVVITDINNNVTTLGPFSVNVAGSGAPGVISGSLGAPNSGQGVVFNISAMITQGLVLVGVLMILLRARRIKVYNLRK